MLVVQMKKPTILNKTQELDLLQDLRILRYRRNIKHYWILWIKYLQKNLVLFLLFHIIQKKSHRTTMGLASSFKMINQNIHLKDYSKVKVVLVIFSDQLFQNKRVKMVFLLLPLESLAVTVLIENLPVLDLLLFARIIVILIREDSQHSIVNKVY